MTTLNPGQNNVVRIERGRIVIVVANSIGAGQAWFVASGSEAKLIKSFAAGKKYQFGPYGQRAELRIECSAGNLEITTEFEAAPIPSEVSRQMGTLTKAITSSTYTLSDDDHGYMLCFKQATTVTAPTGLRTDFSCGWSQDAAGVVTFAAGAGATINSKGGGLASSAQYSTGGIAMFDVADTFRLMGV